MFMHANYDEENKLCYVIIIEKNDIMFELIMDFSS